MFSGVPYTKLIQTLIYSILGCLQRKFNGDKRAQRLRGATAYLYSSSVPLFSQIDTLTMAEACLLRESSQILKCISKSL